LTDDIVDSWEGLRHFIRDKCPSGTRVFILSGDKAATSTLKLRRDRMIPLQTGDQRLRWIQYTIQGKEERQTARMNRKPKYNDKDVTTFEETNTNLSTTTDSWL